MTRRFVLMILLLIGFATGCATTNPNVTPVTDNKTRIEQRGYSILPPEGENWFSMKTAPGSVALAKKLEDSPAHTFTATVFATPFTVRFNSPEEFKEFVEKGQKADTDPNRFTTLEYNISLDDRFGAYTVRYHSKMEDRKAKVSPVDTQFLIMEITGYTFIHPDSPDLVLHVQYSDRYKKGEKDPSLDEIGEKFINNFKVMPLKEADNK